jgi:hypothetical protein
VSRSPAAPNGQRFGCGSTFIGNVHDHASLRPDFEFDADLVHGVAGITAGTRLGKSMLGLSLKGMFGDIEGLTVSLAVSS